MINICFVKCFWTVPKSFCLDEAIIKFQQREAEKEKVMKLSKSTNSLIHKENSEKTEDAFGPQDVANEIEAEESCCAPLEPCFVHNSLSIFLKKRLL